MTSNKEMSTVKGKKNTLPRKPCREKTWEREKNTKHTPKTTP
jgi:hypothetical protein